MDNASKALIMAGAVLIAVALVGLGVYLYRSATSTIESGSETIDNASVQFSNQIISKYGKDGKSISKKQARLLCEDVIRAVNGGTMHCSISGAFDFDPDSYDFGDTLNNLSSADFSSASYTLNYTFDSYGAINAIELN